MNPVFWLLVILGAVLLWFFASFIFYPLGMYFWRLWSDTLDNINRDDKENKKDRENIEKDDDS